MQLLKQSTAATVIVGPVLDTDGAAVTTAVAANFSIAKNGTVAALTTETVTHSANGYYTIELTTTNTNTLGRLDIIVNASTMSIANHRYDVLPSDTYEELMTTGIADAVWDEPYSGHTTAGTFGKLMDALRKSNLTYESAVNASQTPTATSFSTNLDETTGAFNHAVLLFLTGNLAGENGVILSYVNTDGVITLDEALTEAPADGDEFVIIAASHVHPISEIEDALTVAPLQATAPNRVAGTQVVTYINDTSSIGPIAVTDSNGDAVNLSAYTLKVCIEQRDGTVLQNATPTVSGASSNQITWTPNATSVASTGTLRWSLRVVSTGQVIALGDFIVDPAAKISS